jgi:hypothetical protein
MACQFSPSGEGLSNLPRVFPQGGLIFLNDQVPYQGQDIKRICKEVQELFERFQPRGFVLDFQRPGVPEARELSETLCRECSCPVGVSTLYAEGLPCPVLLPPPPLHKLLCEHLTPWKTREIWLEIATENQRMTVTEQGCRIILEDYCPLPEPAFSVPELFCREHLEIFPDKAVFTLSRGKEEIAELLIQAEKLGVTLALGLYQQLQ